jgi:hypothetical protein
MMMLRRKRRGLGPLGVLAALAGAGVMLFLMKNIFPDAIRYARIHRM